MKLSMRARGLLAFLALAAYVSVVGFVLGGERQKLLRLALDIDEVHEKQATLTWTTYAINHSMLRLQGLLLAEVPYASHAADLALDVELIQSGLQGLQQYFPEFDNDIAGLGQDILSLRSTPSRSRLLGLHDSERALERRLAELENQTRETRTTLWATYHRVYDRMTLLAITMNLVGLLVFGALVTLFFNRLAWDIRRVGGRAADVVAGYQGPSLDVTRNDEIGELTEAVNRMQRELRQRDQKLELIREQHYHRERMAAVGSLAAAVAHEINNPIAAIAGIAQTMVEADGDASGGAGEEERGKAQLILEQTRRISAISRQIAEFTRPRMATPELLDLNGLVRNTCKFIGYDQRLRKVDVALELDGELPAVCAVADHLQQVLVNLLINAADALEDVADRKPTIRVATRASLGEAILTVSDNGHGMDAGTLARAFEESFSTKPADKGRGLGLFLCKTLIERDGGRIDIASTPGAGTAVVIHLPLQPAAES